MIRYMNPNQKDFIEALRSRIEKYNIPFVWKKYPMSAETTPKNYLEIHAAKPM